MKITFLITLLSAFSASKGYAAITKCKIGDECAEGEFCLFKGGRRTGCGVNNTVGRCRKTTQTCKAKAKRNVCGCDGVDYASKCDAYEAGTSVKRFGLCNPKACQCTAEDAPICSSAGRTFRNKCKAVCKGAKIACEGKCPCRQVTAASVTLPVKPTKPEIFIDHDENSTMPQPEEIPVQVPGVTRPEPNPTADVLPFSLEDQSLEAAVSPGELIDPKCMCHKLMKPVCSASGNSYNNECLATCADEKVECEGSCPCKEKPVKPLPDMKAKVSAFEAPNECDKCSKLLRPVCGDQGNTYENVCRLRCEGEKLACRGECPCAPSKPVLRYSVSETVAEKETAPVPRFGMSQP